MASSSDIEWGALVSSAAVNSRPCDGADVTKFGYSCSLDVHSACAYVYVCMLIVDTRRTHTHTHDWGGGAIT